MRRHLVLLSLATTVLVVVSFVVPLSLLVSRQAADNAKVAAERNTQSVAGLVALAAVDNDVAAISGAIGDLPEGTIVVISTDEVLGTPRAGQGSLVLPAGETRSTVAQDVGGGWEIALPVVGVAGVVVVDSFVTDDELTSGVYTAWLLLALLGVVLVGAAVWLADRLGRRLTSPVEELASSAHRLAEGDLDVRVEPHDPEELREMGEAFNYLAGRLEGLLVEERENVADLSHRLRTPLTSLRLEAEGLSDQADREAMITQVDRLERAMDQVIELARSPEARDRAECELDSVVAERAKFWDLLAEEQHREMSLDTGAPDARVALAGEELAVLVDTLIDNVFAHTPAGTGLVVATGVTNSVPWLEIADEGHGFGDFVPGRGVSGAGSTGLGLDIVRKTVTAAGGSVEIDDRPGGGAVVRVRFG
ncbi:MAG TPA: HAMP domain-containing sensor histidine kinase [Acidimicrobiia bacterium]